MDNGEERKGFLFIFIKVLTFINEFGFFRVLKCLGPSEFGLKLKGCITIVYPIVSIRVENIFVTATICLCSIGKENRSEKAFEYRKPILLFDISLECCQDPQIIIPS